MIASRPIAFDLGSAKIGVAPAVTAPAFAIARPDVIDVDADDVTSAVEAMLVCLLTHEADAVVLEIGQFYVPKTATPQAARAIAVNWNVCDKIADRIEQACKRLDPPVPVYRIARRSWSCRLVPGVKNASNAEARAAAIAGLSDVESRWFADDRGQHKADALGALRGWIKGPNKPKPRASGTRRRGPSGVVARSTGPRWTRPRRPDIWQRERPAVRHHHEDDGSPRYRARGLVSPTLAHLAIWREVDRRGSLTSAQAREHFGTTAPGELRVMLRRGMLAQPGGHGAAYVVPGTEAPPMPAPRVGVRERLGLAPRKVGTCGKCGSAEGHARARSGARVCPRDDHAIPA